LVLSSLLSDEAMIRSAYLTSAVPDERSVYVLFGRHWGPLATVNWSTGERAHRFLVEAVSTKPLLIRSAIRADRYYTYFRRRTPGGASTINVLPFFSYAPYVDDLAETFVETLRKDSSRPARALMSPYDSRTVLVSVGEVELNLLDSWQMLCGVCDRLDLIDKATTENWRGRFPELDKWFKENRPYILWDNNESHCRIDEKAKELGRPTPRASRFIPELKPSWILDRDGGTGK
jgi:hypothetical protein